MQINYFPQSFQLLEVCEHLTLSVIHTDTHTHALCAYTISFLWQLNYSLGCSVVVNIQYNWDGDVLHSFQTRGTTAKKIEGWVVLFRIQLPPFHHKTQSMVTRGGIKQESNP